MIEGDENELIEPHVRLVGDRPQPKVDVILPVEKALPHRECLLQYKRHGALVDAEHWQRVLGAAHGCKKWEV